MPARSAKSSALSKIEEPCTHGLRAPSGCLAAREFVGSVDVRPDHEVDVSDHELDTGRLGSGMENATS